VIRNIGQELPGMAQGVLSIDFANDEAFQAALAKLNAAFAQKELPHSVSLSNERGDILGFNPHHYSYHTVPAEDLGAWKPVGCTWELAPEDPRRRRRH
jgi:hypothetical protein